MGQKSSLRCAACGKVISEPIVHHVVIERAHSQADPMPAVPISDLCKPGRQPITQEQTDFGASERSRDGIGA